MRSALNEIQPPLHHACPVAVLAESADDEGVAGGLEVVAAADLAEDRLQRRVLELDHLVALVAVEMLVLRVAIVVLVVGARAQLELAEQAGVDELRQRAIDRGSADLEVGPFQLVDELVGVEVAVALENVVDHLALLPGVALRARAAREVLAELVDRTLRYRHGWQLHAFLPS